jgi:hypothetical protein
MVYITWHYLVFGLYPMSSILKNTTVLEMGCFHSQVSPNPSPDDETDSFSAMCSLDYWAMVKIQKLSNPNKRASLFKQNVILYNATKKCLLEYDRKLLSPIRFR